MMPILLYRRGFGPSYVPDLLEKNPLVIILGIPLLYIGCLLYFLLKENGKNAALIAASIFLLGWILTFIGLLLPVQKELFFFLLALFLLGVYIGYKIFKDLKEKNYL